MIVVVSSGYNPDDERIYHRQIKTLLSHEHSIIYFWNASPISKANSPTIIKSLSLFITHEIRSDTFPVGGSSTLIKHSSIKYVWFFH